MDWSVRPPLQESQSLARAFQGLAVMLLGFSLSAKENLRLGAVLPVPYCPPPALPHIPTLKALSRILWGGPQEERCSTRNPTPSTAGPPDPSSRTDAAPILSGTSSLVRPAS